MEICQKSGISEGKNVGQPQRNGMPSGIWLQLMKLRP
jgi:hypothetical protein